MLDKECFEVQIKFQGEYETHVSHVGADNKHEAFMAALSNMFRYSSDAKIVESYAAMPMGKSYRKFLDEANVGLD